MSENSKIEWTHHTFNPWLGCEKVSPACAHCYAESWAKRAGRGALWKGTRTRTAAANWRQPLKWNERCAATGTRERVFCASLADVFDNAVPAEWRKDLFELIKATPHLDWLLLTKRIGNAKAMLPQPWYCADWPNVWIGSTVVTQAEIDRDVPKLLNLAVAVRFLSIEPLLERIDLCEQFGIYWNSTMQAWEGWTIKPPNCRGIDGHSGIDWVIVGGESGGHARPMESEWVARLREQCKVAGTKFFMKQGSAANWPDYKNFALFPEQIRVREFPR